MGNALDLEAGNFTEPIRIQQLGDGCTPSKMMENHNSTPVPHPPGLAPQAMSHGRVGFQVSPGLHFCSRRGMILGPMNRLLLSAVTLLLITGSAMAAAPNGCAQGSGEYQHNLWNGYRVEFAPAPAGAAADQCHGAVKSADGTVIFEISAPEVYLNEITGTDLNGDEKQDVVIESHRARGQCCYTYDIITPGESPALVREITASVPLRFEDLENNGRIEITARDNAFDGFDGLPAEFAPKPELIFRLRGSNLYYVSPAYWDVYQKAIDLARNSISRARLDKFKNPSAGGATTGMLSSGGPQNSQAPGLEGHELYEAKATVLEIVLDYLYGGKGEEAWKQLKSMWPYPDNVRIRQEILAARSRGVLSEVNRPPMKAGSQRQPATTQE
jgi:hypothetical protein